MTDETPSRLMELPTWLISQTSVQAHRLLSEAFAAIDSRGYHYRLLAALEEFGPASQATLGRRTGIDRSDVVAALNDLADRGLIERSPDPSDRRRNIVTVTPAGSEQFRRLDKVLAGVQDDLLAPLSSAERDQLAELLARVLAHHGAK
ncbi:MarR family winged helix-turn-helix transcriptional regulator [Actinomadura sp. 6N118]|uniref:MarR family winged helix-turn-helix transcriptional regulator n=1 Tax=Actinomadura sp. 6N118 TaxID=3375151 RepID=UPI0037B5B415